jgi:hypothetical protein
VQDVHVLAIGLDSRGTPLLLVAEQTGRRRALPLSIGIAEDFDPTRAARVKAFAATHPSA